MDNKYIPINEYWDIRDEQCTIGKIIKNIDVIAKVLSDYQKDMGLENLSRNELLDLLYESEKSAIAIRKTLSRKQEKDLLLLVNDGDYYKGTAKGELIDIEEYLEKNEKKIKELDEKVFKNYHCYCNFSDKMFTLYSPLTFKRGYTFKNFNHNYLLLNYIKNCIISYQNERQFSLINKIEKPYIIVMKRVKNSKKIGNICDNDNLENQRIINEISRSFNLYDGVNNMSLFSIFDKPKGDEKDGMYFYIFSQKDLDEHLDLFKKQENDKNSNNTKNTENKNCTTITKEYVKELSKIIDEM